MELADVIELVDGILQKGGHVGVVVLCAVAYFVYRDIARKLDKLDGHLDSISTAVAPWITTQTNAAQELQRTADATHTNTVRILDRLPIRR